MSNIGIKNVKIISFILPLLLIVLLGHAQVTPAETATNAIKYLRRDISDGRVPFFAKKLVKEDKDQKLYVIDPRSMYPGCLGGIFAYTEFQLVLLEKEYASETDARADVDAMLAVAKREYPLIKLSGTKTGTGDDPVRYFVLYSYMAKIIFTFNANIKEQAGASPEKRYKMHVEFQL